MKWQYKATIGTIIVLSIIAGVTLYPTDYRAILDQNPNATYIVLDFEENQRLEVLTRGPLDYLRWRYDIDKFTLYSGRYIGAEEDWLVYYQRTWLSLDKVDDLTICSRITATRCYVDNYFERLVRKPTLIQLYFDPGTDKITIIKETPYYGYSYASGSGGTLIQKATITGKSPFYMFPENYEVSWIPASGRESSTHKLVWRIEHLEFIDESPKGYFDNIFEAEFGKHIKVIWKDESDAFDFGYGFENESTMMIYFEPVVGTQILTPRLFDPTATTTILYLNGTNANQSYEQGNPANITATINYDIPICLSVDHPDLGENFTCGIGSVEYEWITKNGKMKFNDSSTAKNLTFASAGSQNVFLEQLHRNDTIDYGYIDLMGFDSGGTYPKNLTIDVGNDGSVDIGLFGEFKGKYTYSDVFNDSTTTKTYDFDNQERTQPFKQKGTTNITYIKVSNAHNVTEFYLNISGNTGTEVSYSPKWWQDNWLGTFEDQYDREWACFDFRGTATTTKIWQLGGDCYYTLPGGGNSPKYYNLTIYYDPSTHEWRTLYPEDRWVNYDVGIGACEWYNPNLGRLYVAGGGGNNPPATATNNVRYYDGTSGPYWKTVNAMPAARYRSACVYVNESGIDKTYVFGGADTAGNAQNTIYIFNHTDATWYTSGDVMPEIKQMHVCSILNTSHILCYGGYRTSTWSPYTFYYNYLTDDATGEISGARLYAYANTGASVGNGDKRTVYNFGGKNNSAFSPIWEHPQRWDTSIEDWVDMTESPFPAYNDYCCLGKWYVQYAYYYPAYGYTAVINNTIWSIWTDYGWQGAMLQIFPTPIKPYIQIGYSGVNQWSYGPNEWSGYMGDETTSNLAQYLNDYIIEECTTSPYCDVPVYIHNDRMGTLTVDALNVTSYIPRLDLNKTALQSFLKYCPTTYCNITLNISSKTTGKPQLYLINISYYGSGIYNITAFWWGNATYDPSSNQLNLSVIHSNFSLVYPPGVYYEEFILRNMTQYNVSAYGQNQNVPLWNFTSTAYDRPMNISIKLNESINTCFHMNASSSSTPNGKTITTTPYDYITNLNPGESSALWVYGTAIDCNYTEIGKRWLNPIFVFETRCSECI